MPIDATAIPHLEQREAAPVLMVDGRPFTLLAGEVHNSTSSSPRALAEALDQAVALGMNSVLVPVTWELVEPEEGAFDFTTVDFALALARERGLRLGLLWFGAWKNAQCFYAPAWVKRDLERFPRAQMARGQNRMVLTDFHNMSYSALSLFAAATREADARAFEALMAHLAKADPQHTVVMVQVENECGEQGGAREHSAAADAAFAGQVPAGLVEALTASRDTLAPDIAAALDAGSGAGTWEEVFGASAEELFTSYHMASYVEAVAAAGRAENPLPLAVNCWLDKGHKPGRFPTGGPVARVMEVWRYAAPTIDVFMPDIYVPYFCDVCDEYRKLGNPLAIPETATYAYASAREIWAVGHHHALCFAPFGFEDMGKPFDASAGVLFGADVSDPAFRIPQDPSEYRAVTERLSGLLSLDPDAYGTPRLNAASRERADEAALAMGAFTVDVTFAAEGLPGAAAVLKVAEGEFYVLAMRCMLAFRSTDAAHPHVDLLVLEDGEVRDGAWVADRRLNGDEAAIMRYDEPTLLHVTLFAYA